MLRYRSLVGIGVGTTCAAAELVLAPRFSDFTVDI
jgi:hypothetical protein